MWWRSRRACPALMAVPGLVLLTACPAGVVALEQIAFACSDDSTCAPGHVCVDGTCQPTGTAAALDATTLDAAGQDRGSADLAAHDAAAADGGSMDRAMVEAGSMDRADSDAVRDGGGADAAASDLRALDSPAGDLPPVDGASDDAATDSGHADAQDPDASAEDSGTSCPADWWDCAWADRLKLTFDNSQQGEDLDDFPVLVHLTPNRVDMTRIAGSGADLRFVDPQGQQLLPHEIERWSAGQEGWIWVRVPQIDASSTTDHIWMYFDNPVASASQDAPAVWSQGYRAVWHLNGSAVSSIALPGSNPTTSVMSSGSAGMIGRGLTLDGVDDRVLLTADDAVLGSLTDMTISAWVRRDEVANGWRGIVSARKAGENDYSAGNFVFQGAADSFGLENNQPFPNTWRAELATPRQWHLLSVVVDAAADLGLLYLDGREVARRDAAGTPIWADQDELRIGARWFHEAEQAYLQGAIDEVRVSHVARSAAWQRAQYLAQSDALIRYGEEPWLRPGHGHRVKLQLVSAELEENLINFPVLVTLDGSAFDDSLIQDDADDLRFLDADGATLDHELDVWNQGGISQIWVRVPQVNAYNVTDHIWMYYDNPAVGSTEDPDAVWSDDYLGVWHLGDGLDSTANLNHGTGHGTDHGAGLVAGAVDIDDDGDGERLEVADSESLDLVSNELTASLWMYRQNGQTDWACGMAREMDIDGLNIFWLGFTGNQYMFITSRNSVEQRLDTPGLNPPQGRWFMLAGTYNSRKMRIFADGAQVAVIERTGALPPDDNPLSLGSDTNDHGVTWGEQPEALLDEARLQRVARSPAWLRAEHWSMTNTLILVDAPQVP